MAEIISKPPNYAIRIREHFGGKEVRWYAVFDGIVFVWTEDGRRKATQVGGSPAETMARQLLLELKRESNG
jgi:hypothetical protein